MATVLILLVIGYALPVAVAVPLTALVGVRVARTSRISTVTVWLGRVLRTIASNNALSFAPAPWPATGQDVR